MVRTAALLLLLTYLTGCTPRPIYRTTTLQFPTVREKGEFELSVFSLADASLAYAITNDFGVMATGSYWNVEPNSTSSFALWHADLGAFRYVYEQVEGYNAFYGVGAGYGTVSSLTDLERFSFFGFPTTASEPSDTAVYYPTSTSTLQRTGNFLRAYVTGGYVSNFEFASFGYVGRLVYHVYATLNEHSFYTYHDSMYTTENSTYSSSSYQFLTGEAGTFIRVGASGIMGEIQVGVTGVITGSGLDIDHPIWLSAGLRLRL